MTLLLPIRRDIPPPIDSGRSVMRIYPFADMQPGDCFDAPRDMGRDDQGRCKRQRSVLASAAHWKRTRAPDWRFTVRVIDDATVRCWRIA